jgi:hypothetical protein
VLRLLSKSDSWIQKSFAALGTSKRDSSTSQADSFEERTRGKSVGPLRSE